MKRNAPFQQAHAGFIEALRNDRCLKSRVLPASRTKASGTAWFRERHLAGWLAGRILRNFNLDQYERQSWA
jgi:hypothetical protein